MARLDGKVAIISGGSKGQGAAEAKLFAEEGAKVVITDILDEEGKALESEIIASGGIASFFHVDVTRSSDWNDVVSFTQEAYGEINILVNNAGILSRHGVVETTAEEWNRVNDINSKGVFLGTKAVIPAMRSAGGGSIVNISSIVAFIGIGPAAYTASKGSVRLLTKSTAVQYGPEGIRCNSVHPGFILTDMTRDALSNSQIRKERLQLVPLQMLGTVMDVAYGVLYLASDESRYVTGSELVIDGGVIAK